MPSNTTATKTARRFPEGTAVTVTLEDGTRRPGYVRTDHRTAGHGHDNYTVDWTYPDGKETYGTFEAKNVSARRAKARPAAEETPAPKKAPAKKTGAPVVEAILTKALTPKKAVEEVPAKLPSAAEMRKAIVKTGELTRDQAAAHKGEDLAAAYRNLVLSAKPAAAKDNEAYLSGLHTEAGDILGDEKPAKKTPAKAAKKAPAKAAAEKTPAKPAGPKDDAVTRHITEVFKGKPAGTFLTFREIINATSSEFPEADGDRPGTNAVYSRCHGGRLPAGLTGQNKPCGATKN